MREVLVDLPLKRGRDREGVATTGEDDTQAHSRVRVEALELGYAQWVEEEEKMVQLLEIDEEADLGQLNFTRSEVIEGMRKEAKSLDDFGV